MFKTSILTYEKGSTDLKHLDLTGDLSDDLYIEAMDAAGGHQVLYIHVNGLTMIRICRPKSITMVDRRPQPAMDWLQWKQDVHDGYYWIENDGGEDNKVHRILEVVEVKPDAEGSKHGYWRGNFVPAGFYVRDGIHIQHLEYYADWKGFKAIRIDQPLFE